MSRTYVIQPILVFIIHVCNPSNLFSLSSPYIIPSPVRHLFDPLSCQKFSSFIHFSNSFALLPKNFSHQQSRASHPSILLLPSTFRLVNILLPHLLLHHPGEVSSHFQRRSSGLHHVGDFHCSALGTMFETAGGSSVPAVVPDGAEDVPFLAFAPTFARSSLFACELDDAQFEAPIGR